MGYSLPSFAHTLFAPFFFFSFTLRFSSHLLIVGCFIRCTCKLTHSFSFTCSECSRKRRKRCLIHVTFIISCDLFCVRRIFEYVKCAPLFLFPCFEVFYLFFHALNIHWATTRGNGGNGSHWECLFSLHCQTFAQLDSLPWNVCEC